MDTSTLTEALPLAATDALGPKSGLRRYRPIEEKVGIVEQPERRGASVAEVARRHGLNANLLFGWRRQYRQGVLGRHTRAPAKLLPVRVTAAQASTSSSNDVLEIEALKAQLAKLRRMQFVRFSEKLSVEIEQLELLIG